MDFLSSKEILMVVLGFLFVLSLPFITVLILTNVGIKSVSDRLAAGNPQTRSVQILDPITGKIVKYITSKMVWPVNGIVTLEFGESDLPYQPFHTGIDIANQNGRIGDPIAAFMSGTVIYAGEIDWGYGMHIIIDNGDGVTSIYAHLSEIDVQKGQRVDAGEIIGREGMTGWATGPHLHFQIDVYGIPVNPRTFLGNGPHR